VPPLQHQLQQNQISLPKSFATHRKTFFTPKPTTHKQTTSSSELVRHRHHHPQQRFACTSGQEGKPQAARTTHRTNVIPKPRQKTVHRHPQITTLIPHTLALKDETGMKPG
jgi:hypothetical protein